MKKRLILYCCLSLIGLTFSCNPDTIAPPNITPGPIVLDEVVLGFSPYERINTTIFTSTLEGELIECMTVNSDTSFELSPSIYGDIPAFNITLEIANTSDVIVNGQVPINVGLTTYTNIKTERIRIAPIVYSNPNNNSWERVLIDPNTAEDNIEFIQVSSTIHQALRYYGSPLNIRIPEGGGDVIVLLKLKNEGNWRFEHFENLQNNTSIVLDFDGMTTLPNHVINFPAELQLNFGGMIGILNCEPMEDYYLRFYNEYEENKITTAFPTETFERFYSHISLKSDHESFQIIRMGDPIMNYQPTSANFSVIQNNVNGFWLIPDEEASYYYAYWNSYQPGQTEADVTESLSWQVWGELTTPFNPPPLPECVTDQFPWVDVNALRLKRVAQYEHSDLMDYPSFIQFNLSEARDYDFACNIHGFDGEGTQEIKTKGFE